MTGRFVELGDNCLIQENVLLGFQYKDGCRKAIIGSGAVIRWGSVIYADVEIGNDFKSGHFVMIRENTKIGNRVVVGTHTVIDGYVNIGNFVKIESNVYIPTHTSIGSSVFIGPGVVFTNDKYPQRLRDEYKPQGAIVEDSVSIGGNTTILPGLRIGEGSFIAAGSIVTKDIPSWKLVIGAPAKICELPEKLRERNRAIKW